MRDLFHDSLTGLVNHTLFLDRLDHALAQSARSQRKVALLFLGFVDSDSSPTSEEDQISNSSRKMLELGQARAIAAELIGRVRQADTLARFENGLFALLLEQVHDYAQVETVVQKIWDALFRYVQQEAVPEGVSPSIGVAVSPEHGTTVEALTDNARAALERAREAGGNVFAFADQQTRACCPDPQLAGELRRAIAEEQLHLHYHPLVELITGRLAGLEALVRWQHPRLGFLEPADFLPLAEETGLIIPIGEWVLNEACLQAARWRSEEWPAVPVAVNLSPAQVLHPRLTDTVRKALTASGLPAERLELEISEKSCLQQQEALRVMTELRSMGIRLSLDDFGSGHCPLSSLARLPVSRLKIDSSLISAIDTSREAESVVTALIGFARNLDMEILAEGIETTRQLRVLQDQGCRLGQGYIFGRPATTRLNTGSEFFFPMSFGEPGLAGI